MKELDETKLCECPLCESEVTLEHASEPEEEYWWVVCPKCGCSTEPNSDVEKAIEYWNNEPDIIAYAHIIHKIALLADHGVPFYAYGDNEAACRMSDALDEIAKLCKEVEG